MRRGAALVLGGALLTLSGALSAQVPNPVVTTLTLFAGTADGLWRTRDWGGTWEAVKPGRSGGIAPQGAVRAIHAIGPRVYVGAERQLTTSDDFGETWTERTVPGLILALLPSRYPQADATLFIGTTEGLVKSPDAGRTFGKPLLPGLPVSRIEWPGPALVVATGRGVMVSPDGGATFTGPGTGMPDAAVLSLALSAFFAADPVLFAGTAGEGVFRSADGGKSWRPAGLAGQRVTDLVWLGPFLYAATDGGVLRSEDMGRTWVALREGLEQRPVHRLLFPLAPASGAEIFAAGDQGIFRTPDGGLHWVRSGLNGRAVSALATFPAASPVSGGKNRE
jgi:hypothetical protein